jgi:hypothetical protein
MNLDVFLETSSNGFEIKTKITNNMSISELVRVQSKLKKRSYHELEFFDIKAKSAEDVIREAISRARHDLKYILLVLEEQLKNKQIKKSKKSD